MSSAPRPEGLLWICCCLRIVASLEVVHAFDDFAHLDENPCISLEAFATTDVRKARKKKKRKKKLQRSPAHTRR